MTSAAPDPGARHRELVGIVAERVGRSGPIGFAEMMDLALYHPDLGFYATGGAGRRRDFITSPEVGPLFGTVVAQAIDSWWDQLDRPSELVVVEVGAGPGTLARAVLAAGGQAAPAMRYVAVESSAAQRARHPAGVESCATMPSGRGAAVVFANELLDNLPFDVLEHRPDEGWVEIRIDVADGRIVEVAVPAASELVAAAMPSAATSAPSSPRVPPSPATEGGPVRVPVQRAAARWLAEALAVADQGVVAVVDYTVDGYPAEPGRRWLRTYRDHEAGTDPLDSLGSQDITADVAVDQLAAVSPPARRARQDDWLRAHGIDELVEEGRRRWREAAAAPDLAAIAARSRVSEAEALLDPTGLGAFGILEWDIGRS